MKGERKKQCLTCGTEKEIKLYVTDSGSTFYACKKCLKKINLCVVASVPAYAE